MHTRKEESKAIISRYTKVTDPRMFEGTMQYAYDFVEKILLVKREAFQVNNRIIRTNKLSSSGNEGGSDRLYFLHCLLI